jgi:hypothetical protein
MRVARALGLCAVPLLAAMATGCTATVEPTPTAVVVPTESTGTLIVDWTIQLRTDPGDCNLSGATAIQIDVVTTSGLTAGTFQQACSAFSTSIGLNPGSYQATAFLLDPGGNARTTAVTLAPFTILGGDVVSIPIDFPANSFF